MKWKAWVGLLVVLFVPSSCNVLGPDTCTAESSPGIVVHIRDAAGGVLNREAVVVRIEGRGQVEEPFVGYRDDLGAVTAGGAHETPGTYRVTIQAPGFRDWIADNVRVTKRGCHVETVKLEAFLVRS